MPHSQDFWICASCDDAPNTYLPRKGRKPGKEKDEKIPWEVRNTENSWRSLVLRKETRHEVRNQVSKPVEKKANPAIIGFQKALFLRGLRRGTVSLNQRVDGSSPSGGTRQALSQIKL